MGQIYFLVCKQFVVVGCVYVVFVQVFQFFEIEMRCGLIDGVEIELFDYVVQGYDFFIVVVLFEVCKIVMYGLWQIVYFLVGFGVSCVVLFGQFGVVWIVNEWNMCYFWYVLVIGIKDQCLVCCICEVIYFMYDVGDFYVVIVDNYG